MPAGRDRSLMWTAPRVVAMCVTRSPWLYGPAVGALLLAVVLRIAGAFMRRAPLQEDVAA
jgi:hypothetical protein